MYTPYYNAIKTLIESDLNTVNTIDWYNHQYERYEELNATTFPAVYVEFESMDWQNAGNKTQLAEAHIKLHLVHFYVENNPNPETTLTLAQELHSVLQGKSLVFNEVRLSGGLTRLDSELVTKYNQLKVMTLTYGSTLMDYYDAIKSVSKQRVSPVINLDV